MARYDVNDGVQHVGSYDTIKKSKSASVRYLKKHPKSKLLISKSDKVFADYKVYRKDNVIIFEKRNGGGEVVVLRKNENETNEAGIPVKALKL